MAHLDQHKRLYEDKSRNEQARALSKRVFEKFGIERHNVQSKEKGGHTFDEQEAKWLDNLDIRAADFTVGKYKFSIEDNYGAGQHRFFQMMIMYDVNTKDGTRKHSVHIAPNKSELTYYIEGIEVTKENEHDLALWESDSGYEEASKALTALQEWLDEIPKQKIDREKFGVTDGINRVMTEYIDNPKSKLDFRINNENGAEADERQVAASGV
jgi:hypothetical protein